MCKDNYNYNCHISQVLLDNVDIIQHQSLKCHRKQTNDDHQIFQANLSVFCLV